MMRRRSDVHNRIAHNVVLFLGIGAVLGLVMSFVLVLTAVHGDREIDSAAVALIGQIVSISTLAFGALGAVLSSTSPKPAPPPTVGGDSPESVPVTVVNQPDDPVPTTEDPPPGD